MPSSPARAGKAADHARFVAFAFAGSNILVEVDETGIITFAAGACRTEFGREPETFLGTNVRAMVASADQDSLECALSLLLKRGRLLPMLFRLANPRHTKLALAGLALPPHDGPGRFCLTLALPPTAPEPRPITSAHGLARAAEARLRFGEAGQLGLLDVGSPGATPSPRLREAVGSVLGDIAPDMVAGELAPGRFGLVGDTSVALRPMAATLEKALQARGMGVSVQSTPIPLGTDGLTPVQAARALRQALNLFAREGTAGLSAAGFNDGLAAYMEQAARQATALRRQIASGGFRLAYQPIVVMSDRSVHHYEALIRPDPLAGRQVTPQEFVTLAESLALADLLDLAVAQHACKAAAESNVQVAFNISSQSAQNPAFRTELVALLRNSKALASGLLMVEMTETAEIEDLDAAVETARALRALGVPFCLDDFGAGAADMRVLRALGADYLKLDGSYVPGVTEPGRARAFVAAIIEVARAAEARVIVEQVEHEPEAQALKTMGATHAQGWLFGRPAPLPTPRPTTPTGTARRRGAVQESWG